MDKGDALAAPEALERAIIVVRGHRVMLDETLAELYGVSVKRPNEQVKRNLLRFPDDFMFQLSAEEATRPRSQNATLDPSGPGKHRKYLAHVFTEQGVAMLSSVLRSPRAATTWRVAY